MRRTVLQATTRARSPQHARRTRHSTHRPPRPSPRRGTATRSCCAAARPRPPRRSQSPLCQPPARRLELLNRWAERAGRSSPVTMTSNQSLNADAQAGALGDTTDPDPEVLERARGPRRYSAKYKARILEEYERLDKASKGALLRREGLYTSLISEWRKQRDRGALQALATPAGRSPRPRGRPATQAEPAPGRRARQGPQGDRGPGKALGAVGAVRHRQRPGDRGRDEVTDQAMDQAMTELVPLVGVRAGCQAVGEAQARWYRRHRQGPPPPKPKRAPAAQPRALSEVERTQLRRVLNSPEHVDEAPATVYAKLLDDGVYLGSVPTMYRVLRAHDEVRERRRQATHPAAKKPELLATKPNQVYSWDITKLLGPAKWTYYYLYVLLDVF